MRVQHLVIISCLVWGVQQAVNAVPKEPEEQRNPLGCRDMGYQYDLKVLKLFSGMAPEADADRQSLFFMYNRSAKPVHLYQMLDNQSSHSVFLNHTVPQKQWSALATGQKEMKYICTVDDPKSSSQYGKIIDCGDSIKVCEYARVKFGMNNRGNYWIVDGNTRNGAVNQVTWYGIIPR